MKHGIIHFADTQNRSGKELDLPVDSGNGYYSYSYTETPYTGDASSQDAKGAIYKAVRKKWFEVYSIFTSCGSIEILPNAENTGGIIRVQHVYHHGD